MFRSIHKVLAIPSQDLESLGSKKMEQRGSRNRIEDTDRVLPMNSEVTCSCKVGRSSTVSFLLSYEGEHYCEESSTCVVKTNVAYLTLNQCVG